LITFSVNEFTTFLCMTLSKWKGKYERFGETTASTFHPEGRPSSLHA